MTPAGSGPVPGPAIKRRREDGTSRIPDTGRVADAGAVRMIKLTQLNGRSIVVNADLIEFVETAPDTIISLTTGKKILVRESDEEVIRLTAQFRRMCRQEVKLAQTNTTVR